MKYPIGTIIKGKMNHKAAVLEYIGNDPIAVMVTSKGDDVYPDNLLMKESHFEKGHSFGWRSKKKPSYMVCRRFIKIKEWGKFSSVGKLTEEGIVFIQNNTNGMLPMYWRDYISSPKK